MTKEKFYDSRTSVEERTVYIAKVTREAIFDCSGKCCNVEFTYGHVSNENYTMVRYPAWDWSNVFYRIIPKKKEPKYERFHMNNHIVGRIVQLKSCSAEYPRLSLITEQNNDQVNIAGQWLTYEWLLKHYEFEDGSPCGILDEDC